MNKGWSSDRVKQAVLAFFLTCGRITNRFKTEGTSPGSRAWLTQEHIEWHLTMYAHKCYAYIGVVKMKVPVITQLFNVELLLRPIEQTTLQEMCRDMAAVKIDKRSLRRSGVHYWHNLGMPSEELRSITMHRSLVTLDAYLS